VNGAPIAGRGISGGRSDSTTDALLCKKWPPHSAADLAASVLADLTGICISTAERWSQRAEREWATYVASARPIAVKTSTAETY
jgi:hypothetical protein